MEKLISYSEHLKSIEKKESKSLDKAKGIRAHALHQSHIARIQQIERAYIKSPSSISLIDTNILVYGNNKDSPFHF